MTQAFGHRRAGYVRIRAPAFSEFFSPAAADSCGNRRSTENQRLSEKGKTSGRALPEVSEVYVSVETKRRPWIGWLPWERQ